MTQPTQPAASGDVTQADRILVARFIRRYDISENGSRMARNVLDKNHDDDNSVQEAVRHRLSGRSDGEASFRVKCQRPDGRGDSLCFTFVDRAEFERFSRERPRELHVTDISEYQASTCDEALAMVHDFLTGEPEDDE